MFNKKGDIDVDMIGWIALGFICLALIIIGIMVLKDKGISAIDYLKTLFRMG